MNPVTGPYTLVREDSAFLKKWRSTQYKYKQAKPYNLPLPYYMSVQTVGPTSQPQFDSVNSSGHAPAKGLLMDSTELPYVLNKALRRFHGQFSGDKAALGISLLQYKETSNMFVRRTLQLAEFAKRVKRSDFKGALRVLSQDTNANRAKLKRLEQDGTLKKGSKFFSSNFLEMMFGWMPTWNDIFATVNVLQLDVKHTPIRIKGSAVHRGNTFVPNAGYNDVSATVKWELRAKCNANIRVSNPNLWLANQLGLVNPASVALDAITLSFVVGWFVNLQEVVNSWTADWGLEISDSSHTVSYREERTWQWITSGGTLIASGSNKSYSLERKLGLPSATLLVRKWNLDITKAAISISLLIQRLR